MHPADQDPRPRGWRRVFQLPLSRRQAARELQEEVAFHLHMREEKLMRDGHAPDDAQRIARERFGDVARIEAACQHVDRPVLLRQRTAIIVDDLRNDLIVALRALPRAPAFALASVATLALGIAAATAIFSVAYGVLLRPLPFPEPGQLVRVTTSSSDPTAIGGFLSAPEYLDLAEAAPSFAGVGALFEAEPTLTGVGYPRRLKVAVATPSLFSVLGTRPQLGRLITHEDAQSGAEPVILLSHTLWRQELGRDPAVVGSRLRLDGRERTVIGVLRPQALIENYDAIVPLALDPSSIRPRGAHYLNVVGRLKPGTEIASVRAELSAYARRAVADHPGSYADPAFSLGATDLRDYWVGATRPTLLVLSGAVALLLLLACANVANLLIVRAEAREREVAVRAALGAGRGRLARQQLAEMLLLAAAGAFVGLPLAWAAVRALLSLHPEMVPPGTVVEIDATVLAMSGLLLLLVVLVAGVAPALQVSALDVRSAIASGSVGGGRRGGRLRSTLVLAEVAIATVVLVGAGLVARSFWQLQRTDPGFTPEHVLTFDVSLPVQRYPLPPQVPETYARLLGRLHALPEVSGASAVSHLPMSGRLGDWVVEVEGAPVVAGEAKLSPNFSIVASGYAATMGIPLRAGRDFTDQDRAGSPPVTLVSESLARALWPGEDPLGRRIRLGAPPPNQNPWMEVIGVVGDVHGEGLGTDARPTYYMLDAQFPNMIGAAARSMTVVVRSTAPTAVSAAAIRSAVTEFDPELAVANVRPLTQVVSSTLTRPRFATAILLTFGGAALLLAVIGVYGVLASSVARRRRELGVRLALGSARGRLLALVVRSGVVLAAKGIVVGLVVALALSRTLTTVLHEVSAVDPWVFVAIPLLLLGAATAASLVPALRATRVAPIEAMRAE